MSLLEKLSNTVDINGLPFDTAMHNALVKAGLKNPAKDMDDAHDAKTGETSLSNLTKDAKHVDVAEPDNDGDETHPDLSPNKTWEYGYERGEGYRQYPPLYGLRYDLQSIQNRQYDTMNESGRVSYMIDLYKTKLMEKENKIASFAVVTKTGQKYNARNYEDAVKLKAEHGGKIVRTL